MLLWYGVSLVFLLSSTVTTTSTGQQQQEDVTTTTETNYDFTTDDPTTDTNYDDYTTTGESVTTWAPEKVINDTVVKTIVAAIKKQKESFTTTELPAVEVAEENEFKSRKITVEDIPVTSNSSSVVNTTIETDVVEKPADKSVPHDANNVVVVDESIQKIVRNSSESSSQVEAVTEPFTINTIEQPVLDKVKQDNRNAITADEPIIESSTAASTSAAPTTEISPTPSLVQNEEIVTTPKSRESPDVISSSNVVIKKETSSSTVQSTTELPKDQQNAHNNKIETAEKVKSSITEIEHSTTIIGTPVLQSTTQFSTSSRHLTTERTPVLQSTTQFSTSSRYSTTESRPSIAETTTKSKIYTTQYSDNIQPHSTRIDHEEFGVEVTKYESVSPTSVQPTVEPTMTDNTFEEDGVKNFSSSSNLTTTTSTTSEPTTVVVLPKAFIKVIIEGTFSEFCNNQDAFEEIVLGVIKNNKSNSISNLGLTFLSHDRDCNVTMLPHPVTKREVGPEGIEIWFYITSNGDSTVPDVDNTLLLGKKWNDSVFNGTQFENKILRVSMCTPKCESIYTRYPNSVSHAAGQAPTMDDAFKIVVGVTSVGAVVLILIAVLVVVMRQRHRRFKYARRCRPATLNTYGLDNLSVCGSMKRSKHFGRASKRSYANQAFEDPNAPSKASSFANLATWSFDVSEFDEEFSSIPTVTPTIDDLPPGAEKKNRYSNVIPIPETRVILGNNENEVESYINANFVRGPKGIDKCYIACQAPLDSTAADFWRMVWEQQTKLIIMVTDLVENGVQKCCEYFPTSETLDCHQLYGDYQITLKKQDYKEHFIVSQLIVKDMERNLWREVVHLWFHIWPSQGVPSDPSPVVSLLLHARPLAKENSGPTLVHCSPGTGRTGTLLACDVGMRELDDQRVTDVPNCVYRLRRDRAGAVQTKEQYVFIYKVLSCYAAKLSGTTMDSI